MLVMTPSEASVHGNECFVLLGRRGDSGAWWVPGGHFEAASDSDVLDSARREVLEETGISSTAIARARLVGRDEETGQDVVELLVHSRGAA